ncbi:hypothetical protein [Streptomyces kebangsaanensis]|uniref:hypothetical protein n=1 Tax=Streptomyces kebangsaanensis TaxID=864058 RepID=UPI00093CA8A9|nr:hypothetical protein [Streptomyces kebangsaanensis]
MRGQIGPALLGAALAAVGVVTAALFTPLGQEMTSWVSDKFGWGKTEGQVTALPLLDPCEQDWVMPAKERDEADAAYRKDAENAWKEEGLVSWLKAHDAIALKTSTVDIDVSTDSQENAVLHDVRIKVTDRKESPELAAFQPECGGPGYYYSFGVPLHELPVGRSVSVREMARRWPDLVVLPSEETGADASAAEVTERARPLTLPMTMSVEDIAKLRIKAFTDKGLCQWEIQLVWAVAGDEERHTETIDFEGEPFRTAALPETRG